MKRLVHTPWRWLNQGFLLIAEPRVVRLVQFGIYVCLLTAGWFVLTTPPRSFEGVLGQSLVTILGCFILVGGTLGAVAVLPGVWWLERVGILALATGLAMYSIIVVTLGASPIGVLMGVAFILTFVQRWMEIRKFQLAPKRG
ncbi:MAG: hypothetical protein WED09_07175 [Homoserinimonas sp.]